MSAMQSEVHQAFRKMNVPEQEALDAAAALSRRDADVGALKADTLVVKALLAVNTALLLAVVTKLFVH